MLLVVTYSASARGSLRNVRRSHEECIVRSFGRSALLEATELGAFLALRLQEKHPEDVQIEVTRPLNEFIEVPEHVREAVQAYETREHACTPYSAFAAGTDLPDVKTMAKREL